MPNTLSLIIRTSILVLFFMNWSQTSRIVKGEMNEELQLFTKITVDRMCQTFIATSLASGVRQISNFTWVNALPLHQNNVGNHWQDSCALCW